MSHRMNPPGRSLPDLIQEVAAEIKEVAPDLEIDAELAQLIQANAKARAALDSVLAESTSDALLIAVFLKSKYRADAHYILDTPALVTKVRHELAQQWESGEMQELSIPLQRLIQDLLKRNKHRFEQRRKEFKERQERRSKKIEENKYEISLLESAPDYLVAFLAQNAIKMTQELGKWIAEITILNTKVAELESAVKNGKGVLQELKRQLGEAKEKEAKAFSFFKFAAFGAKPIQENKAPGRAGWDMLRAHFPGIKKVKNSIPGFASLVGLLTETKAGMPEASRGTLHPSSPEGDHPLHLIVERELQKQMKENADMVLVSLDLYERAFDHMRGQSSPRQFPQDLRVSIEKRVELFRYMEKLLGAAIHIYILPDLDIREIQKLERLKAEYDKTKEPLHQKQLDEAIRRFMGTYPEFLNRPPAPK